ncbi:hypothetical protein EUX98_g4317 [Antrodiella citrinella]|uniref:Protein kinase domain-containing protein n=1 Tax=Antrodiella citrinella TaxID=2447956 RepID=A0A4S4N2A9_9APHY|nr:hypothetical protein EUX98_g4317 [Antrodiella citrinella]
MVHLSVILPDFTGRIISTPGVKLQLCEKLGAGAYGVVYLARDLLCSPKQPPRLYAVKCLLLHPSESEYARAQEREIFLHKNICALPNVVTLHHVITEERYQYLVMDYCPGGDLYGAIVEHGIFEGHDSGVKKAFVQLVDALHGCHENGIYHRDLKPENVMCSLDYEEVYLSDFGLATQVEISNTFGCGSSFYMSPECLGIMTRSRPYATRESDVWSLGVILTNMITGRNPWHVASPMNDEGFRQFLREGASYLYNALHISADAANILTRIFDPNPDTRITLLELREAVLDAITFFQPRHFYCCNPDPYEHLFSIMPATIPSTSTVDVDASVTPRAIDVDLNSFPVPPLDPPSIRASFDDSDSETDSGGPVTPPSETTMALPVDADIPEISLAEDTSRSGSGYEGVKVRRFTGSGILRGNRKRVFAGIGLGIGSFGSSTGSRLSRKIKQSRVGESAHRLAGVVREIKARA